MMKSQFILHQRLWWWPPWGVTDWWLPRMWRGNDEWCNLPLCINIPPLGAFITFWGPLRNFPCRECWDTYDDDTRAEYLPGGELYRGGTIPYIEQWHINNALAKLREDKERYRGYAATAGGDPLKTEFNKGIIAAMSLCELYIADIATQVPPTPPRLQDELMKATQGARKNVGDLIIRAGEWLQYLGSDW